MAEPKRVLSRDEFIARWRYQLAGMAIYGVFHDTQSGTIEKTANAISIPAKVEQMLNRMYGDLRPEKENGNDS